MNEQVLERAEQAYQSTIEAGLDEVAGNEWTMRLEYPRIVRDALREFYAVVDQAEQAPQA